MLRQQMLIPPLWQNFLQQISASYCLGSAVCEGVQRPGAWGQHWEEKRGLLRTGEGCQGCPCPRSLPPARSFHWQPSFPAGDTLSTLAVNCAEPKLFHPSCILPALMNYSKCE